MIFPRLCLIKPPIPLGSTTKLNFATILIQLSDCADANQFEDLQVPMKNFQR